MKNKEIPSAGVIYNSFGMLGFVSVAFGVLSMFPQSG
jgi:hypothetical protein